MNDEEWIVGMSSLARFIIYNHRNFSESILCFWYVQKVANFPLCMTYVSLEWLFFIFPFSSRKLLLARTRATQPATLTIKARHAFSRSPWRGQLYRPQWGYNCHQSYWTKVYLLLLSVLFTKTFIRNYLCRHYFLLVTHQVLILVLPLPCSQWYQHYSVVFSLWPTLISHLLILDTFTVRLSPSLAATSACCFIR